MDIVSPTRRDAVPANAHALVVNANSPHAFNDPLNAAGSLIIRLNSKQTYTACILHVVESVLHLIIQRITVVKGKMISVVLDRV